MKAAWWCAWLVACALCNRTHAQAAPTAPEATPTPPSSYAEASPQPQSVAPFDSPTTVTEDPPPLRSVSVTISPLHLLGPIIELTAEFRLHDQIGVAVIGGVGRLHAKRSDGTELGVTAWELGASLRGYVVGDFDQGMQLGAEVLIVHVDVDRDARVTGTASGAAIGPMVGYKYTSTVGFTFDGQLGVQWVAMRAEATDGVSSDSAEDSRVIPLLNVNIGWSF